MLEVRGFGADIEYPMPLPEVVKLIQRSAEMPDKEAYGMFGMGHGTINATDQIAAENGIEAKVIGVVTKDPGISVRSAGARTPGRKLKLAA
jgi:phosphoribosylaminoimidazole (AIR) synthetase